MICARINYYVSIDVCAYLGNVDNIQDLVSIFDGQPLINSIVRLPDNPTKQDLLLINETLNQLFQHDLQKLKDYYQTNITFVQKKIKKMD